MSGRQDFSEEHNWFNQWRLMDVNTEKEILNTVNTIFSQSNIAEIKSQTLN